MKWEHPKIENEIENDEFLAACLAKAPKEDGKDGKDGNTAEQGLQCQTTSGPTQPAQPSASALAVQPRSHEKWRRAWKQKNKKENAR